jgi:hypothetical protein
MAALGQPEGVAKPRRSGGLQIPGDYRRGSGTTQGIGVSGKASYDIKSDGPLKTLICYAIADGRMRAVHRFVVVVVVVTNEACPGAEGAREGSAHGIPATWVEHPHTLPGPQKAEPPSVSPNAKPSGRSTGAEPPGRQARTPNRERLERDCSLILDGAHRRSLSLLRILLSNMKVFHAYYLLPHFGD